MRSLGARLILISLKRAIPTAPTATSSRGNAVRIAQVTPLFERVPTKLYGGTERVVSYLTVELVRLGHDVTLFSSGASVTGANLITVCPEAMRVSVPSVD